MAKAQSSLEGEVAAVAATKKGPAFYWEDLSEGDVIESAGMTITDAHLVNWAGLTGDIVSLHLDEEYASETPFGQRIGHGPLTLSLALGLITQRGYFSNVAAWLGLDGVRAKKPVFIGDTIHAEATLRVARETSKPGVGIWTFDYVVLNQRGETVMVFETSFMLLRRPAGGAAA